MPAYCDVAVPVPLHDTFTYRIPLALAGQVAVGGRVVVPFRQRKLVGVVTAVAEAPRVAGPLKDVPEVRDAGPPPSPPPPRPPPGGRPPPPRGGARGVSKTPAPPPPPAVPAASRWRRCSLK